MLFKKNLKQNQTELLENLEGLGDILVYLTENKRNSEVIPTLRELGRLINRFFDLQQSDPNKFEKLMLAEEYWTDVKEDKEETQFRLSFTPDRYLITFSSLLNQIIRVFEVSIKVENDEITRHACYQLVIFLAKVSETEKSELFVKEILKRLLEFSRRSIELKSTAAHPSTYSWYVDVVFNKMGQEKGFRHEEYLDIFNDYFLQNLKYLVSNNKFDLFKNLVGNLVDGIHVSAHDVNNLWDYLDLLAKQDVESYRNLTQDGNATKKISSLIDGVKKIYKPDQLNEWLERYEEFKGSIYPLLNRTNKIAANKLNKEIKKSVIDNYVNQSLRNLIFITGAWALYKKQTRFISEIWTYKQPEDARASYGGNDLFPQTLLETVDFYFRSSIDDILFWDDHHDGQIYISQYFLLLLVKYLKPIPASLVINETSEKTYAEIENFVLPFEKSSELSNIKFQTESLLVIAEGMKNSTFLQELSIVADEQEAVELIDKKLIPFLKRLISNADEKNKRIQTTQPLSDDEILKFKQSVYESYTDSASLKKIFEEKNKFENNISGNINNLPIIGINEIAHREMFIDDWHVSYSGWGKNYGRAIGEAEDLSILNKIINAVSRTSNSSINEELAKFEINEDIIIFASVDYIYEYLEKSGNFRPYWTEAFEKEKEPHFQGWYIYKEKKIKVFAYHLKSFEIHYAIVDLANVGKVVYHNPLSQEDDPEILFNNLRIKIKDFSNDNSLIQTYLTASPSWLSGRDENEKIQNLRQYMLLQIGSKSEFVIFENPKGIFYSSDSRPINSSGG